MERARVLTRYIYICRLQHMKLRLSPQTLEVLEAFLQAPRDVSCSLRPKIKSSGTSGLCGTLNCQNHRTT